MNEEQAQALGALLRERRLALGYSTYEVGDAAGVPNSTVVRLEQGKFAAPSPAKLARFAQLLGFGLADLYARAGYLVPDELPNFGAYLLAKYPTLPGTAIADLQRLFDRLAKRFGLPTHTRLPQRQEYPSESIGDAA